LKFPEDVQRWLMRRYQNQHRLWLTTEQRGDRWTMEIALGTPTEQVALTQWEGVRAWQAAWQSWSGVGELIWCERRWRSLGTQRVPEKLILSDPKDVAQWVGESARWSRASVRYAAMIERWPVLAGALPKHFNMLADYSDTDFERLIEMLSWIVANPHSHLYPRQLPIAGINSKWLESHKGPVSDLVATIHGDPSDVRDFFQRCGLKAQPEPIRLRILDPALRSGVGGLGDITAPWEQVAALNIPLARAFIVENLQTGLAFDDLPGAIVIMRLGYGVDVLGRLPWLASALCVYWGDLDTHGFAILNRARVHLPELQSVLMDEETLLSHQALWVEEKEQHPTDTLPLLTASEQDLYQSLKQNKWGQNVRLEQERVHWDIAWRALQRSIEKPY
jgi:hypothetical protein